MSDYTDSLHADLFFNVCGFLNAIDAGRLALTSRRSNYLVHSFRSRAPRFVLSTRNYDEEEERQRNVADAGGDAQPPAQRTPNLLTECSNKLYHPPNLAISTYKTAMGPHRRFRGTMQETITRFTMLPREMVCLGVDDNYDGVAPDEQLLLSSIDPSKTQMHPFHIHNIYQEGVLDNLFANKPDIKFILLYVCASDNERLYFADSLISKFQDKFPSATICGGVVSGGFVSLPMRSFDVHARRKQEVTRLREEDYRVQEELNMASARMGAALEEAALRAARLPPVVPADLPDVMLGADDLDLEAMLAAELNDDDDDEVDVERDARLEEEFLRRNAAWRHRRREERLREMGRVPLAEQYRNEEEDESRYQERERRMFRMVLQRRRRRRAYRQRNEQEAARLSPQQVAAAAQNEAGGQPAGVARRDPPNEAQEAANAQPNRVLFPVNNGRGGQRNEQEAEAARHGQQEGAAAAVAQNEVQEQVAGVARRNPPNEAQGAAANAEPPRVLSPFHGERVDPPQPPPFFLEMQRAAAAAAALNQHQPGDAVRAERDEPAQRRVARIDMLDRLRAHQEELVAFGAAADDQREPRALGGGRRLGMGPRERRRELGRLARLGLEGANRPYRDIGMPWRVLLAGLRGDVDDDNEEVGRAEAAIGRQLTRRPGRWLDSLDLPTGTGVEHHIQHVRTGCFGIAFSGDEIPLKCINSKGFKSLVNGPDDKISPWQIHDVGLVDSRRTPYYRVKSVQHVRTGRLVQANLERMRHPSMAEPEEEGFDPILGGQQHAPTRPKRKADFAALQISDESDDDDEGEQQESTLALPRRVYQFFDGSQVQGVDDYVLPQVDGFHFFSARGNDRNNNNRDLSKMFEKTRLDILRVDAEASRQHVVTTMQRLKQQEETGFAVQGALLMRDRNRLSTLGSSFDGTVFERQFGSKVACMGMAGRATISPRIQMDHDSSIFSPAGHSLVQNDAAMFCVFVKRAGEEEAEVDDSPENVARFVARKLEAAQERKMPARDDYEGVAGADV